MQGSNESEVDEAMLLSPDEMAMADRLAISSGASGETLMRDAASAVAASARRLAPAGARIAILAGSGNNGGDAYAAASLLAAEGFDVVLFALTAPERSTGDAGTMARDWVGQARPLDDFAPDGFPLVVDGLFGAGLTREVEGTARSAIDRLNEGSARVLAIDLPSGVRGADGSVRGVAVRADATVTFFRRKPGHLLLPGRILCGRVEVAEIGIDASVLAQIAPRTFANEPALFGASLLRPSDVHHKYDRGHAVVFSGGAAKTGAARLSAMAALRGGAGLVTVFSPSSAMLVNAAHLTAIMLRRCEDVGDLADHLEDERFGTFVLGPGFGDLERARAFVRAILEQKRSIVLDADAITAFADRPDELFEAIAASGAELVATPHDGEFARLFPDLASVSSKLDRARRAAQRSGAVIVLKGADTVVAEPDGRASINGEAPANLATAGTGDVLTGLVAAQLANGVPAFEAACAAVWLHARAAMAFGPGLIAEDLPALIPQALAEFAGAS